MGEWYIDPDSHGTINLYFLAGVITYMELYEEQPISNYIPPIFAHGILKDNYRNIISRIYLTIKRYDNGDINRSVFCNSITTDTENIILQTVVINFMPDLFDDRLTIAGMSNELPIKNIDKKVK